MRRMWLGVVALAFLAQPVLAQEKETEAEEPARDQRPHVQVLKHPYDISSFYRSPGGNQRGFSYGYTGSFAELYSARDYDSDLPLSTLRPDLRGRVFGPRWDREFDGSNLNFRLDGWGTRRRFERRRTDDSGEPRPAPSPRQ